MHKGALRRGLCNGGRGHKDQLVPAGTSWYQLVPSWYPAHRPYTRVPCVSLVYLFNGYRFNQVEHCK